MNISSSGSGSGSGSGSSSGSGDGGDRRSQGGQPAGAQQQKRQRAPAVVTASVLSAGITSSRSGSICSKQHQRLPPQQQPLPQQQNRKAGTWLAQRGGSPEAHAKLKDRANP